MSFETTQIVSKKDRQRRASLNWRHRNIEKVRAKQREDVAQKRSKNRSEYNDHMRYQRTKTPISKIKSLLYIAKGRAEKLGIDFDISAEQIIIPTHCPLLGIEINYAAKGAGGQRDSASIDRIDSSRGYVEGNVWIVSWRANRLKSDATIEELQMICDGLQKKMNHAEKE